MYGNHRVAAQIIVSSLQWALLALLPLLKPLWPPNRIERNKDDDYNDTALILVIDEECTHHRILDNSLNTDGADESDDNKGGDERT